MAWIPAAVAGGSAILGGILGNQANSAESARNRQFQSDQSGREMEFQERMSNTAYQRGVKDMEAAGLNPMLAYSQGGASAPSGAAGSGSQAVLKDVISPAVSAYQSQQMTQKELEKKDSEIRNIDADTENKGAMTPKIQADARVSEETIAFVRAQAVKVVNGTEPEDVAQKRLFNEMKKGEYEAIRAKYETLLTMLDYTHMGPDRARKIKAEARLLELEIPKALNEAAAEDTSFKKYVSPFIGDIKGLGTAGAAARYGIRR